MQWSPDAATWQTVTTFTDTSAVSAFSGVYAANSPPTSTKVAPAWTVGVDYVRDGSTPPPTTTTATTSGTTTAWTTTATTTATTTTSASTTTTASSSTTSSTGTAGAFASDDFSESALPSQWAVVDPVGGANVALVGHGTSDALRTGDRPARRLRPRRLGHYSQHPRAATGPGRGSVARGEVRLEADREVPGPGPARAAERLAVVLVSSIYSNGKTTYAFAASTTQGTSTTKLNKAVMLWTGTRGARQAHRLDLVDAGVGGRFGIHQRRVVQRRSVWSGVGGAVRRRQLRRVELADTALVDYIFDTASPIVPEDGGAPPDVTPPTVSNLSVTPGSVQAVVKWTTNEPTTGRVQLAAGSGTYVDAGTTTALSTSQSVTLTGLTPSTSSTRPV